MARLLCDCTVRDPDAIDFNQDTGEITIPDATPADPDITVAGSTLVFRLKAAAAYKLAIQMLAYHKRVLDDEVEDLYKETLDSDELIAELRDHIQRLECPYETRQEADE